MRKKQVVPASMFIVVGLIMGLGISSNFNFQNTGFGQDAKISKETIGILTRTNQAMVEVAAAVKPAVVNISSTKTIKSRGFQNPFSNDPFFRRFFGDEFGFFNKPREHKQSGLGSGVIVDKDGYILTNNHVISDADEIKVKLSDKREFKGKIVGTDPKTDLAVIKIDSNNLPVLKIGDSDALKVGETVIAVGNPFGLNQTVTSGIVSATGRANVGIADYEDFIQTDAPINPGNSGGALVNVRGELVGINTAIFSTSGGYQGIGFAVPSSMARTIMETLVKKGKIIRGWLGVSIQPVTADLAKQFGLKDEKGALVGDVVEDSPAEKAGIQRGDVIMEYDGKEVGEPSSLRTMVANTSPGKEVKLKALRDGKPVEIRVVIAELTPEMAKQSGDFDNSLKGVHVQDITPELRKSLDLAKRINGVVITDIEDGSPSEGVLAKGDVIMEVNKKRINNSKEYTAAASKVKAGQNILLLIYRNGSTIYITLS
ncbi:MAG: DegQ family serine endoprotease [Deltaproteobacteria bacterium]|nr:DegQ family serine endoprotease [Deltaproteobacteria bacterium]